MHYHAWLRSGRVFTMAPRRFNDRTVAHKWAVKKRPNSTDRFVLGCEVCPESRPSRRRPPRWSVVARAVAAAVDAPADQVREALAAAIAAERGRPATSYPTAATAAPASAPRSSQRGAAVSE